MCDNISECSSERNESLNFPNVLAARYSQLTRVKGARPNVTCSKAIKGICFGNVDDSCRQKVVWIECVDGTREFYGDLVVEFIVSELGWRGHEVDSGGGESSTDVVLQLGISIFGPCVINMSAKIGLCTALHATLSMYTYFQKPHAREAYKFLVL